MSSIIGIFRIGNDVEVRYTPSGEPVASLSLAYNYGKKGADGYRPTQWIDASLWGQRCESLAPHLIKGGQIYAVIDDPHIEVYRKGDGSSGHKLAGRIANLEFAGSKQQAQGDPGANETRGQAQQRQAAAPAQPRPAPKAAGPSGFDDMDDDIPF